MEKILSEILLEFFDNKTVAKFSKKKLMPGFPGSTKMSPAASNGNELSSFLKVNVQIDLIITYSEDTLPAGKFVELLLKLGEYYVGCGEHSSAVYIFEKILSRTRAKKEFDGFTADSFRWLGEVFSRQAVWEISFSYIKRALEIYKRLKKREGIADCENLLGTIYGDIGNLKEAELHFEKAYSFLPRNLSNRLLASKIKTNLGIINNIAGNFEKALEYYKSALSDFESADNQRRTAEVRHNLGMLFGKLHNYKSAHKEFDKSIKLSRKTGDMETLGLSYIGKANLYAVQKEYLLGEDFAEKALRVCQKSNDMLSIADIYKIQGIIQRELRNYDNSATYLLTSLRLNKELNNKLNQAETELEVGKLLMETGNKEESREHYRRAINYFKTIGDMEEVERIKSLLKAA